ncbi:MAG: helix-turn-helix transcriptional regulator [Bacillota bacterium]
MNEKLLNKFIPIVKGIAKTFGSNCEVVLHDFKNLKNSIITIENGHITGRDENSPMTETSIQRIRNNNIESDIISYSEKTADGRILKSSTIFIKDENGKHIGCLCINFDITDFIGARKILDDMIKLDDMKTEKEINKVNVILSDIVKEVIDSFGKPVTYLSKQEKVLIVQKLDNQGAFLIKGAIDYVAEVLHVSKYTIYNYLDEVKEEK